MPWERKRLGMFRPPLDPHRHLFGIDLNSRRNMRTGTGAYGLDGMRVVHVHDGRIKVPWRIAYVREQFLEALALPFEFIAFSN